MPATSKDTQPNSAAKPETAPLSSFRRMYEEIKEAASKAIEAERIVFAKNSSYNKYSELNCLSQPYNETNRLLKPIMHSAREIVGFSEAKDSRNIKLRIVVPIVVPIVLVVLLTGGFFTLRILLQNSPSASNLEAQIAELEIQATTADIQRKLSVSRWDGLPSGIPIDPAIHNSILDSIDEATEEHDRLTSELERKQESYKRALQREWDQTTSIIDRYIEVFHPASAKEFMEGVESVKPPGYFKGEWAEIRKKAWETYLEEQAGKI